MFTYSWSLISLYVWTKFYYSELHYNYDKPQEPQVVLFVRHWAGWTYNVHGGIKCRKAVMIFMSLLFLAMKYLTDISNCIDYSTNFHKLHSSSNATKHSLPKKKNKKTAVFCRIIHGFNSTNLQKYSDTLKQFIKELTQKRFSMDILITKTWHWQFLIYNFYPYYQRKREDDNHRVMINTIAWNLNK